MTSKISISTAIRSSKFQVSQVEVCENNPHWFPQLIKSLKKALEPVLTDVRIDWFLPENLEAFLSPSEIPPLYPGDRLIGYCTLYDMTNFKAQQTEVDISAWPYSPTQFFQYYVSYLPVFQA